MLRHNTFVCHACGIVIWIVTALVACGPRTPPFPVRGAVTLDGQPTASGEIPFNIPARGSIGPIPVRSGSF
jgi:hypothetical protein